MKKTLIILGIIVVILIIIISSLVGAYNKMVTYQEDVSQHWSQVENVYQRRADLIPNLVATVKGYAQHEKSTFEGVTNARAKATSINVDASKLDPASIKKFQEAQGALSTALGKLLMVKENYPDLKANKNFLALQSQLEGTENRITVERMKFNHSAQQYNTYIRKFPKNLIASMFGFEKKGYFKAQAGAEKAPKVKF